MGVALRFSRFIQRCIDRVVEYLDTNRRRDCRESDFDITLIPAIEQRDERKQDLALYLSLYLGEALALGLGPSAAIGSASLDSGIVVGVQQNYMAGFESMIRSQEPGWQIFGTGPPEEVER